MRGKRILFADDDEDSRRLLVKRLSSAGYEVVVAEDGLQAWDILESDEAPALAVLDWMMPGVDGIELCRRLRRRESPNYVYAVLLTSCERKADVVAGLEAGADDYLTKPFDWDELRWRLNSGERILELKSQLGAKVSELEHAVAQVKQLEGLLPICTGCKRIRDDADNWQRIEGYIEKHSKALFTHSLCASCLREHYPEYADGEPVI